jgi:hypothetical protein
VIRILPFVFLEADETKTEKHKEILTADEHKSTQIKRKIREPTSAINHANLSFIGFNQRLFVFTCG